MLKRSLFLVAILASAGQASAAGNCDELMAQIEAKIRGAGVTRFLLATVAADATVPGKVVGTCDRGAKKIVYDAGAAASASSASSASGAAFAPPAPAAPSALFPSTRRNDDRILTECKDGSVSVGGDCKP